MTQINKLYVLNRLYLTIASRKGADPDSSYTASLFAKGVDHCAQKFGEEAVETIIAASGGTEKELIAESADTLYHLMVMLASRDVSLDEVMNELVRREGVSGHVEKAKRKDKAQ